ncbi:MAG: hypothetical protein OEZ43_09575 [Gammaproteobacteria bacterium]|nr:hypothetical protein [Gammaproteobacteria bacterium]
MVSSIPGVATVNDLVTAAVWNPSGLTLRVSLNLLDIDKQVTIWDLTTGELIAQLDIGANGVVNGEVSSPILAQTPCEVAVFTNGRFQIATVADTGLTCDTQNNKLGFIENQFPRASILSPGSNQRITVGTAVFFTAPTKTGVTYDWSFGGVVADSQVQTPGYVMFTQPGTFVITLDVVSAKGLRSLSPATVSIEVVP